MLWQRRNSKSLSTGCEVDEAIEAAEAKASEVREVRIALRDTLDARFNRLWGQMFKAGHRDSRFAQQVNDFACLYTSRASNLGQVAPNRPFRPEMDRMPHDSMLSAGGSAGVVAVAHASGLDGATKQRGGSGTGTGL
jgi:hypothetical protein